jgi:etoposide-induced 2.4 mRNA
VDLTGRRNQINVDSKGTPQRVQLTRELQYFSSRLYGFTQSYTGYIRPYITMLQRRVPAASSGSPSPGSSTQSAGPGNTAYTPLKRRESANLYPAPASATKARYPLLSPGFGSYGSSGPGGGQDALGLSSPIHNIGGTPPQAYGYLAGPSQYGGARPYGLATEGGTGATGAKRDVREMVVGGIRNGVDRARRGFIDAVKLDRSWNLAWK